MRIHVTDAYINQGVCKDSQSCAVALALLDQIPSITSVLVGDDSISLCFGLQSYTVNISKAVKEWIHDFDEGKPVKPMSFNLAV